MSGRPEPRFAAVLVAVALAICAVLAISGCGGGGGGGSTGVATDAPTRSLQPSNPAATLAKCEPLYGRVYASTARRVKALSAAGPQATAAEKRELRAAALKHEQALEFCEEEIELAQVARAGGEEGNP
jgi:hypothetical protein